MVSRLPVSVPAIERAGKVCCGGEGLKPSISRFSGITIPSGSPGKPDFRVCRLGAFSANRRNPPNMLFFRYDS